MPAAVLTIDINARLASLEQAFQATRRSATTFAQGVIKELKDIGGVGDALKFSLAGIGIGFVYHEIVDGLAEIKQAATDAERSTAQLVATLKATGGAAGLTKSDLASITEGVKVSSVFKVEDIQAAEAALLRFRTIQGDTFKQAISLAPDVATALGSTLPQAAELLGKALTNPQTVVRGLRDAGLQLSEQQVDLAARLIETGDKAGAQAIILRELTKSIGGLSESDTTGLYGSTKRADRAYAELKATLGAKTSSTGFAEAEVKLFTTLTDKIKEADASTVSLLARLAGAVPVPGLSTIFGVIGAGADKIQEINDAKSRTSSGKIGILGQSTDRDKADAAAATALAQQAADEEYTRQKIALQKRADTAASFFASELSQQRAFLQTQTTELEFGYAQGLVPIEDFYARQRKLAEDNLNVTSVNLGKQAGIQEQLIGSQGANPEQKAAARARLLEIANRTADAQFAKNQRLLALDQQEIVAVRQLDDAYSDLSANLAQATGDLGGAARIRFAKEQRDDAPGDQAKLASAVAHFDAPGALQAQQAIDQRKALGELTIQQGDLTEAARAYQLTMDRLGLSVERVNLEQSSGAITTLDGINRQSAANAAMIPVLEQQYQHYKDIASALPGAIGAQAQLEAEKMRLSIDKVASSTHQLSDQIRGELTDDFATAFTDIATGAKKPRDALKDLATTIDRQLVHRAGQSLADSLLGDSGPLGKLPGAIAGLFGEKTPGESSPGWTSGFDLPGGGDATAATNPISSFLSTLFAGTKTGGAGAANATSAAGVGALGTAAVTASPPLLAVATSATTAAIALTALAAGSTAGALSSAAGALGALGSAEGGNAIGDLGGIFGGLFASGGSPPLGKVSIVGENGPEYFIPRTAGTIIPSGKQVVVGSGSGGGDTHNHTTSTTNVAINMSQGTSGRTASQLAKDIRREFIASQRFS